MTDPKTPQPPASTEVHDQADPARQLHDLMESVKSGSQPSPFDGISSPTKRAWLCAYALTAVKARASAAVGISNATIYTTQWAGDVEFMAAMDQARIMSADVLEAEAHRRAVDGWDEPVGWYKGEAGGTVRRYSDVLLIFTLKGLLPDRYRERVDVRGVLAHLDVNQLPDALVARLAAGENPITVLAPVLQGGGELPALSAGSSDSSPPDRQD